MNRSIEELILQELRELKESVNSLCVRMDALEARMDTLEARMDTLEARMDALEAYMDVKFTEVAESVDEVRCACNTILEWADSAYENMRHFPRIGDVRLEKVRGRAVRESGSRYYVAVKA